MDSFEQGSPLLSIWYQATILIAIIQIHISCHIFTSIVCAVLELTTRKNILFPVLLKFLNVFKIIHHLLFCASGRFTYSLFDAYNLCMLYIQYHTDGTINCTKQIRYLTYLDFEFIGSHIVPLQQCFIGL